MAVVAMLEAHDVPCFVQNAGFGGLYPGPRINSYNSRVILVPVERAFVARELIRDFKSQPSEMPPPAPPPSSGKLRMVVELLLFGWFMLTKGRPAAQSSKTSPSTTRHAPDRTRPE